MKKCERCFELKPLEAFSPSKQRRDGRGGYCKECNNAYRKEWNASNPEKVKARWTRRKEKDCPIYREQHRMSSERYRLANRDKSNDSVAKSTSKNPDRHCRYQALRRAKKLQATPPWANQFFIEEIYDLAKRRTRLMTGGHKWHVDHIVPLKSDLVCGLHVHNNLRVIPGVLNASKGNRHWPDMPSRNEI